MAAPRSAITRTDLSATVAEFDLAVNRQGFVGASMFRPFGVPIQAANLGKIPIEALLVTKPDDRAPGAGYRSGDFEFTTFSYATNEHGWEEPLDDRTLKIYRDLVEMEAVHSQRAIDQVLRNVEMAIIALVQVASTGDKTAAFSGMTSAITEEWDTQNAAVPVSDVNFAKQAIRDASGLEPNCIVMNKKQFVGAMIADSVTGLLKYWGGDDPKDIGIASARAIFDLPYVFVAGGIKNTAKEGQSVSLKPIWHDESVFVGRIAVTDDPREACVGRTFMFTEDGPAAPGDGGELAVIVEEYRNEQKRGSVVRARTDYDPVIMYAEAGYVLTNAITI